ncbi:MAG TPA: PQQ-binding-like beta-propeller repeat protein [Longilinea sp.]|nr:PQQ-binding-like beta-propeller repeat protein [Longilinea sp.]
MKAKYTFTIMVLAIAAVLLTACGGAIPSNSFPGVSAVDDVVYLANAGEIYAIRLADGVLDWQYPAEKAEAGRAYFAPPVMAGDRLLAGDYLNTLHALDPKTGTQQWTYSLAKRWVASPMVVGDVIIAPNADKSVYGFNLDGTLLWKFGSTEVFWAQPTSDGKLAFVAGMDHFLYAIMPQDGSLVWKTDLGSAMAYPAAVGDGKLYQTTIANELVALNAETGEILWRFKTDDAVWMQPLLREGVLYMGDVKGNVYAVDAASGTQKWKQALGDEPLFGTPAMLENGMVFSSETGNIILVDYNGTKQWNRTIEGKLYSGVVLAGDTMLVGVTKGKITLVAFDLSGNQKWSYPPQK